MQWNISWKLWSKIGPTPCVTNMLATKKIKTGDWVWIVFKSHKVSHFAEHWNKTASKVDNGYVKYLQTCGIHMEPPNNKGLTTKLTI